MTSATASSPPSARIRIALLLVVAGAAALRFVGLSWGLRHHPDWDEQAFVESVISMVREGDLDQRFYEYPGLFFHILFPFVFVLSPEPFSREAYLVSRAVVAGLGVASVGLTYALGARLVSPRAGVVAALLLAVSPIEVTTAHMVRPDVALEALVLLALLSFVRIGPRLGADSWAGAAVGAAVSVKATGAALVPAYIACRWLRQGRRWGGAAIAATVASIVAVGSTAYVLVVPEEFLRGLGRQWTYHYTARGVSEASWDGVAYYLGTIARSLGPSGTVCAMVGLWQASRRPARWAPTLVFCAVLVGVLATAEARWIRLVVPALGALSVVAGLGFEELARRWRPLAWGAVLAGSLVPALDSVGYVREVLRPGTRDRAVDWIESRLRPGGRVLSSMAELGFTPGRVEVLVTSGVSARDRLLARSVDAIVSRAGGAALAGCPVSFLARARDPDIGGPPIDVCLVPEGRRRRYTAVPVAAAMLRSSSNAEDLPVVVDGRLDVNWKTAERGTSDEWVEVDLGAPWLLGRVELLLGRRPNRAGRHLRLFVAEEGGAWRSIAFVQGRPPVEDQHAVAEGEASEELLLEPVRARGVRIVARSRPRQRWGFAELRLSALEPP